MIYVRSCRDAGGYDAQGKRYVILDLLCDTDADLPATNYFSTADVIIAQGSTADSISSGAKYQMQSDGTWTLRTAGTAAYTKAEVDTLLSDRIPFKNSDYTPLITAGTWDLFTLPVGIYYRTSNISAVANIPADLTSAFFCIIQNTIGSNRRQIILFPCVYATTGTFYRCLETGSGYGSWYRFDGTKVQ